MYAYTWPQWLMFFYIYCFIGWIFESTYVSIRNRRFVNRGFLRAPLLPLYGTGAITMLWVSIPVKDNLILTYFAGVIGATLLEYVVGVGMEALFKVKYWDYSDQKFNFQGRICLSSSIAWGFLTLLLTDVVHKPIEGWVLGLPDFMIGFFTGAVSAIFVSDTIVSVKAALDLRKALEGMTRIRAELESMQVQLSLAKMETRDQMEEQRQKFKAARERLAQRLEGLGIPTREQLEELKEMAPDYSDLLENLRKKAAEYNRLSRRRDFFKDSLLKGNPGATSAKFSRALRELQERLKDRLDRDETDY